MRELIRPSAHTSSPSGHPSGSSLGRPRIWMA